MLISKRSLAARQREMRKRQPPPRGRGRPRLPLNPDDVVSLASRACDPLEIAAILGCSPKTIRNRFREDFERGRDLLSGRLKQIMFGLAMKGDWKALKWEMEYRGLDRPENSSVYPFVNATRTTRCGGYQRGLGRHRVLSRRAPKKVPWGAKNSRHQQQSKVVIPEISEPAPAPKLTRAPWRSYEILW